MSFLSATVLLVLVINPLGNIPLFLCALKSVDPQRQQRVLLRELLIGLAVLVVFLFTGRYILLVLGVSQSSLGIAGGIILMLIAIKMIFSGSEKIFENTVAGEPFVVPLAIPLIAGPASMTTAILLMARDSSRWLEWLAALVAAWVISSIILLFSHSLSRLLGDRGLTAIERLTGMILTTVAVEMFITGVRRSFFN